MPDKYIQPSTSSSELRQLALDHNWDDGFAIPRLIADHPNCDLAVALELFWLADADTVYLGEARESPRNAQWRQFSKELADRIIGGHYSTGMVPFEPPLTAVQIYNLRKKGLPEIFLTSLAACGPNNSFKPNPLRGSA
ncbi:hypothetical protein CSC70_08420 [Pseudoxanthomonas kalamensis DSM 18571]|uniref:DUF4274 domain-containing protein n=1 Tax=Pseudoxanthomonas kalamensis TaxID=289483 RepID=UPI001391345C|nr:DUF4274 domain-containing protein [Pseudoxanthomonas kalamensis]KAF1710663.1 hypothetical protein CSC70_08420 [Pseudoxanthomonas kalamensis DSM 18571]